jgi:hypothetical protein
VQQILNPARSLLESAGLAAGPQEEAAWTEILLDAGVNLVSPLGQMQRPPLAWRQGGRPRVGEWILRTADEA